jgi:hypothetical protein
VANGASNQGKSPLKRRHQGPGDLDALRRKVWSAVLEAEALLMRPRASIATKLRAIHALTQVALAYQRIVPGSELEERIRRLEEAVLQRRNGHVRAEWPREQARG